jgi:hypothetical protein
MVAESSHSIMNDTKTDPQDALVRRGPWLDLKSLVSFEISSEDAKYPIDCALREDG